MWHHYIKLKDNHHNVTREPKEYDSCRAFVTLVPRSERYIYIFIGYGIYFFSDNRNFSVVSFRFS